MVDVCKTVKSGTNGLLLRSTLGRLQVKLHQLWANKSAEWLTCLTRGVGSASAMAMPKVAGKADGRPMVTETGGHLACGDGIHNAYCEPTAFPYPFYGLNAGALNERPSQVRMVTQRKGTERPRARLVKLGRLSDVAAIFAEGQRCVACAGMRAKLRGPYSSRSRHQAARKIR